VHGFPGSWSQIPFGSVEHTSGTTVLEYSKIYQDEKGTINVLAHIGCRRAT
jgi:hypothetical protein